MAHAALQIASVFLLHSLVVQVAVAAEPFAIGPLNLGMSLEGIRAAMPEAGWRNEKVSPFSSRAYALASTTPVEIAGLRFQAYAEVFYYHRQIHLDAAIAAVDANDCERAALAWLADIEPQAGPFTGGAPRVIPGRPGGLEWRSQASASGSVTLSPAPGTGTPDRTEGERVNFGKSSTALVEAYDELYRPRPRHKLLGGPPSHLTITTARRDTDQQLEIVADYGAWRANDDEAARVGAEPGVERPGCRLQVSLQRVIAPPAPEPFVAGNHPLRVPPSLAERHLAYPRGAPAFAEPIDVEFSCDVSRQTGFAYACEPEQPAGLPVPLEEAALNIVRLLEYDMTGVDRDDPLALRGPVRIRLEPGDRQSLDFLDVQRTPFEKVIWERAPAAGEVPEVPMPYPGAGDAVANPVSIELACRILTDGSLVCAGLREDQAFWRTAAMRLAAMHYQAAPALRDGTASAGLVIDLTVRFRPAF